MPGSQPQTVRGLQFAIRPASRRKIVGLRWPFYFENENPSFYIDVERVAQEDAKDPWPNGRIEFAAVFENGTDFPHYIPVPTLGMGERETFSWPNLYVSHPGQTQLILVLERQMGLMMRGAGAIQTFLGLYSYRVRTEESLWIAAGFVLLTLLGIIAGIVVPFVSKDAVIVYQSPTLSATPLSTPGTASSPIQATE